jgi:hypothetical protein
VQITLESGSKVAKFSLAVKEFAGDHGIKTTSEAWSRKKGRILEAIKMGREVAIMGRLAINTYYKQVNGQAGKTTKPVVKLLGVHACGRKQKGYGHQAVTEDTAQTTIASSRHGKRTPRVTTYKERGQ